MVKMLYAYYILFILLVGQVNLASATKDKSKQVRVAAFSPGCSWMQSASVLVNNTNYVEGFDGINIVVIETDKLVVFTGNVNNEVKSVNASVKQFINDRVRKPGTVVVFTTQLTCFDDFVLWYNSLRTIDDLIVDEFTVGDIDMDTTIVIMACYVKCPYTIQGALPISKFENDDASVKLEVTIGVNGYVPPASQKHSSSSSITIAIVVIVVILILIAIIIVVFCCWRKRQTGDIPFICCNPKGMRGDHDKEEKVGLSTDCENQVDHQNQYTPLNSCLMQEQDDSYTTLEKKEIPRVQIGGNQNEKRAENLYYTPQVNDCSQTTDKETNMELYEPFIDDKNKQIPQPSPTDVVIKTNEGDNIIYNTPSGVPTLESNTEQHYQTPNKVEIDAEDGYQIEAGHGRKMFKRGETKPDSGKADVELSDSHTYKTPRGTPADQNHNIYQQPKKSETLTTPNTSPMQSSPGSSHRLFQQHQQSDSDEEGDFASYIQLNQDDDVIYKTPSNVSKYDAPKSVPQNIYQVPTNIDASGVPDSNIYDPVNMEAGQEEDDDYENTSFLKT